MILKSKIAHLIIATGLLIPIYSAWAQGPDAKLATAFNFDFERGTTAIDNWTFSNDDGAVGRWEWSQKVHSGNRALRVVKSNSAGYSMLASDFIPATAGKSYEVSAQVHVEGRSRAAVYFMVSQYSADSDAMLFPNSFSDARAIDTGDGWKKISLTFPVREGSARIRIHALMSSAPISVSWDNIQLQEVSPSDVAYKPRIENPVPEVLPPLEPAIEHLKKRQRSVAERRVVNGRVRYFLNGKMAEPTFHISPFPHYADAHIADFKNAGVKIYMLPLVLGHGTYGKFGPWLGKDKFDWKEVDERLWRILRVDPDAHIMFYMGTDPYLTWGHEHPDAVVRDQHGEKVVVEMHVKDWGREPQPSGEGYQERWGPSYISPDFRRDTQDAIRRLIRHVQTSLPGKAVVGYHIVGGADGQFFPWSGYKHGTTDFSIANFHLADYSPDSLAGFRDWLRRRYKDVASLRRAWNQPDVTFETAIIPTGERRLSTGFVFDAKTEEDIADYNRFYSEGTVETLQGYARAIKEESRGQSLVSTYWEDAAACVDGHFATGQLLKSPDFDFLAGPTGYGVRMPGEAGASHSTWGSLMLRDRIWVSEQDFRTWLSSSINEEHDRAVGRANDETEHNNMVRRESGMMLAFGQGTWWYEMDSGWFADAGIMRGVKEARQAFTRDLETSGAPRAEVAVFISERSLDYLKNDSKTFRLNSIRQQIRELNRAGVPYQLFLQEDVNNPKLPDFKLYLFLNAQNIEPDEWSAIQKLKNNGKTLCFVHSPGIIKPQNVGAQTHAEAIEKVTGIRVSSQQTPFPIGVELVPDAPQKNLPIDTKGTPISYWNGSVPGFIVDDAEATPLGVFGEKGTAVAYRDLGTWKSVFFGGVGLSDTFINALANRSGAWVASAAGDAVFANQHFLTIHALWDSEKKLTFLQDAKVIDLTDGKILSPKTRTLTIPMKRGETRWFYLATP